MSPDEIKAIIIDDINRHGPIARALEIFFRQRAEVPGRMHDLRPDDSAGTDSHAMAPKIAREGTHES